MTETLERDPIEARLHATLRAKAAQVVVPDHAFEVAVAPLDLDVARRAGATWLVGVLAVAAAVAGAVIVVGTRPHGASVATRSSAPATAVPGTPTPNPIPAPLLAPSWIPDGEQLWSVSAERGVDSDTTKDQLFGTVGSDGVLAPGLLIEFQPASPGDQILSGTPATVRGHQATTQAAKDAGSGTFEIDWIEGDVGLRATVRGATLDEAVAAIDALRPRDANLMDGFEAAASPGAYPLLGESRVGDQAGVDSVFQYSSSTPAAGATPDFTVVTFTTSSYPGYLRTWMAGARASDGTARELDPDAGLFVSWPDGRQVVVESSAKDAAVMQRIAASAAVLDASDASNLAGAAAQRVANLPALGTATLPDGEITVHGDDPGEAACLWFRGRPLPTCTSPFRVGAEEYGGNDGFGVDAGSVAVDGRWYVFAIAIGGDPVISRNGGRLTDLPTETGRIGDQYVELVVVPDGVDHVQVMVPAGTNGDMSGTGFTRPTP